MLLDTVRFNTPVAGEPVVTPLSTRAGFVLTTHQGYGVLAADCIRSLIPQLRRMRASVLDVYLNEPTDATVEVVQDVLSEVPESCTVFTTVIHDQVASAILTGTWNRGTTRCLREGCDVVVFANHDILFNRSLLHLIQVAGREDVLGPVGCLMLGLFSSAWQLPIGGPATLAVASQPDDRTTMVPVHEGIHGALFAVNRATLARMIVSRDVSSAFDRDYTMYFDENFPTGGNENEFHARWSKQYVATDADGTSGSVAWVVTSGIQAHASLGTWRPGPVAADRQRFFDASKTILQALTAAADAQNASQVARCTEEFIQLAKRENTAARSAGEEATSGSADGSASADVASSRTASVAFIAVTAMLVLGFLVVLVVAAVVLLGPRSRGR